MKSGFDKGLLYRINVIQHVKYFWVGAPHSRCPDHVRSRLVGTKCVDGRHLCNYIFTRKLATVGHKFYWTLGRCDIPVLNSGVSHGSLLLKSLYVPLQNTGATLCWVSPRTNVIYKMSVNECFQEGITFTEYSYFHSNFQ